MPRPRADSGRKPTPGPVTDIISGRVTARRKRTNTEVIRLLDPCCGAGNALRKMARRMSSRRDAPSIETYGIEIEEGLAGRARTKLDHVLHADMFQSTIAHSSFNLLFLNPPPGGGGMGSTGHSFLAQATRYLTPGGALIYTIPREDLKASARHLTTNYQAIRLMTYPAEQYLKQPNAVVVATKRTEPERMPQDEEAIQEWSENLPEHEETTIRQPDWDIWIDGSAPGEVLFSRRYMDPHEAALEARQNGVWNSATLRSQLWPDGAHQTSPLMSPRKGHIATMIASGLLNNISLEQDGRRILVNGRTTKKRVRVQVNNDVNEREEVWQDRMSITVYSLDLNSGEITEIQA